MSNNLSKQFSSIDLPINNSSNTPSDHQPLTPSAFLFLCDRSARLQASPRKERYASNLKKQAKLEDALLR